ncbi:MAG: hypothetical protein Q9225_005980 [Loekoesia sp. 1 TL-2023]
MSQDEDIKDYPYAYLVTAPRFLGYSFNPVSFWYLYNGNKELQAMILEVNNTFDERRMYFLKDSSSDKQVEDDYLVVRTPAKFKNTWPKDFHVSPFNSRKGSYALSAQDPFSPQLANTGKIDNTITLTSSKAHAKLIARIFSTQTSIDPTALSYWARLRFIASWWWVGFVTFPRIVKEAGKLFFRRKLHVWYRPEVLKESIGRRATNDEIIIERTFRSFLRALVECSNLEYPLKYISPIPSSSNEEILTPESLTLCQSSQQEPVVLKITTPLFYARVTRYSHISEFLSNEILMNDDKDRTFYVSHPRPLLQLFDEESVIGISADTLPKSLDSRKSSIYDRLSWRFLLWLRNYNRHPSKQQQSPNQIDIRHFGFSQLDHFAMHHESQSQAAQYRNVVTKILLSDVLAFGYPDILDAVGYGFRVLFSYLFVVAVKLFWAWALGGRRRTVRTCYQAEHEAWCEDETYYG